MWLRRGLALPWRPVWRRRTTRLWPHTGFASSTQPSPLPTSLPQMSEEEQRLIKAERRLLDQAVSTLRSVYGFETSSLPLQTRPSEDEQALLAAKRQLSDRFCVTVLGEFNGGKSSLLNALAGQRICKDGVTPTTSTVQVLQYGRAKAASKAESPMQFDAEKTPQRPLQQHTVYLDLEWLKGTELVDTPGTNAVLEGHQRLTEELIPRSDVVLFVTSADQPFSSSERTFMQLINTWRRKIVILVNKIDVLDASHRRRDLDKILEFVSANATKLLLSEPPIFPVSAKLALDAKMQGRHDGVDFRQSPLWLESGFDELESFLRSMLHCGDRRTLKLDSPLGVVDRVLENLQQHVRSRAQVNAEERDTLDSADNQMDAFAADVREDFALQMVRLENVLLRLLDRSDEFFSTHLTFTNLLSLLQSSDIRRKFEVEVVSDFAAEVEQCVAESADWIVSKNMAQLQSVSEFLLRRAHDSSRAVGEIGSSIASHRKSLAHELQVAARTVSDRYHQSGRVGSDMSASVRTAVLSAAALQASAIGIGALVSTAALDVTGLAGAGALTITGLCVLPIRREQLKKQMRAQILALRREIIQTTRDHLEAELQQTIGSFKDALGPHRRCVRVEESAIDSNRLRILELRNEMASIRSSIAKLNPLPAAGGTN